MDRGPLVRIGRSRKWLLSITLISLFVVAAGTFLLIKQIWIPKNQMQDNQITVPVVLSNDENAYQPEEKLTEEKFASDVEAVMFKPMQSKIEDEQARVLASSPLCSNGYDKPSTYLANYQKKPVFRPGYTLPRLSHWAWGQPLNTAIELTGNWGYALEIGEASDSLVTRMLNPTTNEGKMYAKSLEDPERYPLQVGINRWVVPASEYPKGMFFTDADGNYILSSDRSKVFSTEATPSYLYYLAKKKTEPLRKIADMAHIAIILHGGESDLGVAGFSATYAAKDPKAVAARGAKSWATYFSEKKAYQESIVTDAVRSAVPDRQAYIYYTGSPGGASDWGYGDPDMRNTNDILSTEMYFNYGLNIGYTIQTNPDTGEVTNNKDMLSQALSGAARHIEIGQPLSYNWVTGGWWGKLGRLDLYLGFLKSYYMSGMIGAVAGYFDYPRSTLQTDGGFGYEGYDGFDSCFDPNIPFVYENRSQPQPNSIPHWLTQMIDLSQAHSLFSWLEPFLRNGSLVEGPNKSALNKTKPAYELPTGFLNTRSVARKLNGSDQWIVSAWAADGVTRDVTVTIREGLNVTLRAIPEAHVYYVTPQNAGNPVMIDTDPNNPSLNAKVLWDNNVLPHS